MTKLYKTFDILNSFTLFCIGFDSINVFNNSMGGATYHFPNNALAFEIEIRWFP